MTKKTFIKYIALAIILIGALVGIKFLIDHLTEPDTPDYYGEYVGNNGYSIIIDKDGLHFTLDGETETYQDYTVDGNTISFADQKIYFYENNKVLSAGIKGSELFNMSCDTPTRNSNFVGEWISYDSSFGVTLTYVFNSNGTFTRYQALVNNYEAGTYTLKDGVLILSYINAFTNANYYTEVCYVDETHTLHTTVFVKSLSDFIPAVQTPTPDISQPSDNDTPSTDDDSPSEPTYTITYYLDGGTPAPNAQAYFTESDLPLWLTAPIKQGYSFKGWYVDADFSGNALTEIPENAPLEDYSLYAKWEPQIYYITYNVGQGTMPTEYVESFNQTNLPLSIANINPTRTGYTFDGWYSNSSFLGEPITQLTETKSYELYAKYSENISYTITYKYNDMTSTQTVRGGDIFTLITPSRQGYNFSDWYDYDNYQTVTNGVYNFNKNINLTARWEIINYNINYNLDGGTLPEGAESTFNIDSLPYSLPTPTKENCSFIGWYENSDFSGEPILTLSKDILKNYTLYAKFTDNPAEYLNFMEVDGYQVVTGYVGKPYYITIPETHNGLPVTTINENAFSDCDSLTSVTIPDSVTSIGSSAFDYCTSLTSVTIGNSVTSIGYFAFGYCSRLTSITIPDSVTSIGSSAFDYCYNLTSVTIPDGLYLSDSFDDTNIPITIKDNVRYMQFNNNPYYYAYDMVVDSATTLTIDKDCKAISIINSSITRVNISDLSSWCEISFDGYQANPLYRGADLYLNGTLVEGDITIPSTANIIRNYVFYKYGRITSVTIPDSVTRIYSAFYDCDSLTSVTIGNSVTSIGGYAFYDCDNLTSVTIGNSVTSIGGYAFYDCDNLTSVTIPDSVTSIGEYAFRECASLTSVTIGNSVTSIGEYAFEYCSSLTEVNYLGTIEEWCGITFGSCNANPIYYAKKLYINGELLTNLVIPNTVTEIKAYAFYNCDSLTSVTIGNSVTSIGEYAFHNCDSLTSVYYMGNADEWGGISVGSENSGLTGATRYYYSETEPTEQGNYWHYVDGVVAIWE